MSTTHKAALAEGRKRSSRGQAPALIETAAVLSGIEEAFNLPTLDNTPEALAALLKANEYFRGVPWPEPFDVTRHRFHVGDARKLGWVKDESVHLIVTSPPYWTLKQYESGRAGQLGDIANYEKFLLELDKVWQHCARALVGGGRLCCVVGDVCVSRRKNGGRHFVAPLHADIQVRSRQFGLDCLTPILWQKIANGANEAQGNGTGFYGKPYQPGAIIKNDVEYILFLRKGGEYRSASPMQKALSMLTRDEMKSWMRWSWLDIGGASTKDGHPAPFPVQLAERLIKMFSFAGDTVLDPFAGTGSTALAAMATGRNSISNEIEPKYLEIAQRRMKTAEKKHRKQNSGALRAEFEWAELNSSEADGEQ